MLNSTKIFELRNLLEDWFNEPVKSSKIHNIHEKLIIEWIGKNNNQFQIIFSDASLDLTVAKAIRFFTLYKPVSFAPYKV